MTEDRKMQAGDDPADFTNAQVLEYLSSDGVDQDEVQRVLDAERGGQARVGILSDYEDAPETETAEGGTTYDEAVTREDTTSAFIIPNYNTIPQSVQDEDAAARNAELEDAGVNQAQGFIGSDGAANLLG